MEIGLATFVDLPPGVSPELRMRELLEEAELADQLGLDLFAVGEHHRPDFVVSSPAVALAAIAARTERIRLSSAVTVLSSDDPVRVFQQFAELDLISVVRAGKLGLPLTIAIIGGEPERFAPLVELYRRAGAEAGHDPATLRVAINTHAFVGATAADADRAFAAPYLAGMNRIGRERGWPPAGRAQYEALRAPRGALAVGDPAMVIDKLLFEHELFGHDRYIGQMSVGAVAHADVMRSI